MDEYTAPKIPVQFRIGSALLDEIDDAVLTSDHLSRNSWMVGAIQKQLERGKPVPHHITASHLLHDKVTIMVRVEELTLELVDEQCDELQMDRTLWLTDAMVSELANGSEG